MCAETAASAPSAPHSPTEVTQPTEDAARDGPSKLVQMRLRPNTVERVERLQELLEADNRTQAVVQAIKIADWLTSAAKEGASIHLEWPDGKKEAFKLVGIW